MILNFKIFDISKDKSIVASFSRRVYLVDDLKTKILIENDILSTKRIVLNLDKEQMIIDSYQDIIVQMYIVNRTDSSTKRAIISKDTVTISTNSIKTMSFRLRDKQALSNDRDFMFIFKYIDDLDYESDVLSYIVDANIAVVQIRNTSDKSFFLSAKYRLDAMQEYKKEECYITIFANIYLTTNFEIARHDKSITKNWIKKIVTVDVIALTTFQDIVKSTLNTTTEMITSFDIIVYDELSVQTQLIKVVESYLRLWHDDDSIVNISEEEWMSINLKLEAKIEVFKVYSLKSNDRVFLNETFDKLYTQERIKYITQYIEHEYSVFMM